MKTQVLIIGAGPTGLMLANQLNRFGIDFIIIDGKSGPTEQSRALAVSARSMELYQQLGLAKQVKEDSTEVTGFQIFQNGNKKAEVNLENLGNGLSDFPNFMNAFEQSKNEALLFNNLKDKKENILWNYQFQNFEEYSDFIKVNIINNITYENKIITAKYLVGCDGASSNVRKQLKFAFNGGTYENKFFVVDTQIDWNLPYNKVILAPSDYQFITFFPLKGDKKMRVIGTLPKSFKDDEEIDIEKLETIIKNVTKINLEFIERGWNSIYKLHHRSVNKFSRGNVFLAGDAAHIHSPAGGQGMNTGLQDTHNLSWKLAMVIKGYFSSNLLDTYNEERLPVAKKLLNSTDGGFTFLAGEGFIVRWIRKIFLIPIISKLLKLEKFKTFAFKKISQIDYSYNNQSLAKSFTKQKLAFSSGDRLPYIENSFYEKFKEPAFYLICITKEQVQVENKFPYPVKMLHFNDFQNWTKFGVVDDLFMMVRPDQHIFWISDSLENNELYTSV
jgi:2-polyprenyl-6-methoxyphenol hydroxylase-like FAD-dependent oxidoreductase